MPLRYFGSVGYYAAVAREAQAAVAPWLLFDKRQKAVHRCEIADTRGRLQLTVPIVHPHGLDHARWDQTGVSSHGRWWHVHRQALEAAYGRTPFFEFYIDRFEPFFRDDVGERYGSIAAYDLAIDAQVREILLLPPAIIAEHPEGEKERPWGQIAPSVGATPQILEEVPAEKMPEYYQVRAREQGFHAGLSVVDLIFNLGPEAALYLRKAVR